jgi:hypothetical protein
MIELLVTNGTEEVRKQAVVVQFETGYFSSTYTLRLAQFQVTQLQTNLIYLGKVKILFKIISVLQRAPCQDKNALRLTLILLTWRIG